ncbi:hypothetical protein [Nostoc sp.]|uniref:hypothetical protein n=1 Tax=Nostoc sp. TaxID=1180 RepID=UPI002FF4BDBB
MRIGRYSDRLNNNCVGVARRRHRRNHNCVGVAQSRHRTLVLPETTTGRSHEQPLQLVEFDKQAALELLCQGQTVIPFWCDACGGH